MLPIILLPLFMGLGVLSTPIPDGIPIGFNDRPFNETGPEARDEAVSDIWGGYLDSCWDIRYYLSAADMAKEIPSAPLPYLESPVMVARCPTRDGGVRCSTLHLGDCLSNMNGNLVGGLE
jgi:hypothetical protein